jgi:cation diffusion facilitator family transporter
MASKSKIAIYAALGGNLAVAAIKFVAAAVTGSSAMASETIHSIVDTGNEWLLLYGMRQSGRPPDAEHPYGHGRELYFWSLIVALTIFAVGGGVSMYEGVNHLFHPKSIEDPFWNYVVLALAFVFEGISWVFGWRAFRTSRGRKGVWQGLRSSKDPSSFLVFFEDSGALLGLLIAFMGIFLGRLLNMPYLDGVASIAIGVLLGTMAVFLAYETKGLLIGEGYEGHTIKRLREIILADGGVEHVNRLLTLFLGPEEVMLTIEVRFCTSFTLVEMRAVIARLKQSIRAEFPEIKRIYFAAESVEDDAENPATKITT